MLFNWRGFLFLIVLLPLYAFAVEQATYQAKIIKPDGNALEATSVNFKFTILNPIGDCVLFSEAYSAVNMLNSGGVISFALGAGTKTYPTSGTLTFAQVFSNVSSSLACEGTGTSFTPIVSDNRKIVMQFNDGGGWQTLPAMSINAVPYAMYANSSVDSSRLNGKADTAFIQKASDIPTCDPDEMLYFNNATFSCVTLPSGGGGGGGITSVTTSGTVLSTAGTASAPVIMIQAVTMSQDGYLTSSDYAEFKLKLSASSTQIVNTLGYAPVSGSAVNNQITSALASQTLSGDVSGDFASTQVDQVGGKSASEIATSVDATLNASASLVNNSIVKRDLSGNSSFNIVSANQSSVNYANIYKLDNSFSVRLQASSSLSANYTLTLPTTSGTVGQVLSTDGTGQLSWINPATGSITAINVAGPIQSTGGATPTLSITQASSSTDGYLSASDYTTFTNKFNTASAGALATAQSTLSALANNQILQVSGSTIVNRNIPSCGINEYLTFNGTNWVCATDSGSAGAIASINVTSPISSTGGANPTISIAQASFSADGYLSSSDFTTFNNKQTATSAAIIATLGYVPASATSLGNYLVKANNLSDLVSSTVARSNLGLGSLSVLNSIDLGSIEATGTLSPVRLPSLTGDVSSVSGSNLVTVNGLQGRSIAATAPTSGQILAYDGSAWSPAANTSSQWATSGTTINYMAGNVGIGTISPQANLMIVGVDTGAQLRLDGLDTSGAAETGGTLRFGGSDSITPRVWAAINGLKENSTPGDSAGYLKFNTRPSGFNVRERMRITSDGDIGIGTSTPTAVLNIKAGTSTNAPLKFTSGTLLTSAQSGTMEYDGFNYYLTDANNIRRTIATGSSASSIDNASNINSTGNITMTPTGSVVVSSTTASTNSSTGALIVKGGLGVAGNIYSSGTIVTSGNIQGSSITATSGVSTNVVQGNMNLSLNPNGGNVGIGTTSPNQTTISNGNVLTIKPLGVDQKSRIELIGTRSGDSEIGMITFLNAGSSSTNTSINAVRNGSDNVSDLYIDAQNLHFRTNNPISEKMTITSAGNVGIGTINPQFPLQVVGGNGINQLKFGDLARFVATRGNGALGAPTAIVTNDIIGQYAFNGYYDSTTAVTGADLLSVAESNWTTGLNAKADLRFRTTNGIGIAEKMRITGDGNVGVGTPTPLTTLQVSGTATFGNPNGSSYNENIRLPAANNDYASIALGSSATAATGTNSGQWTLIRFPAAGFNNMFSIRNNSTDHFAITASGSVGIGTTAPAVDLDIRKTVAGAISARIRNDDSSASAYAQYVLNAFGNSWGLRMGSAAANSNKFNITSDIYGTAVDRLTIDTSGNVGIGTSAPSELFEIAHPSSGSARFIASDGEGVNRRALLFVSPSSGTDYARIEAFGYGTSGAGKPLVFNTIGGGNVGVGTASPNQKLEIAGTSIANSLSQTNISAFSGNGIRLSGSIANSSQDGVMYQAGGGGGAGIAFGRGGSHDTFMSFYTNSIASAGAISERMRIDTAGNVGIGTTSPQATLDVNGSIAYTSGNFKKFQGLNISMAPVADGTNEGYLLLAKAYTSGNVANSEVQGRLTFSRGGPSSSNRTDVLEVSSKSAYQNEYFTVNSLSSFSSFITGLYKVTYLGVVYHAIGFGSTGGSADNGIEFNGLTLNAGPIIVRDDQVTSVTSYGNIGFYNGNGNLGVGTTSPDSKLRVVAASGEAFKVDDGGAAIIRANSNGTVSFEKGNVGVGTASPSERLHVVGNLRVQGSTDCTLGNGAGGTNCSSDARLKENIKPIPYALEKVISLKGVEFDWNQKSLSYGRHDIGVIAQDVEKVFPTAVIDDKNTGYKKVDYAVLVAPLIQALKELYALVVDEKNHNADQDRQIASIDESKADKAEIEMLKSKNLELQNRLERLEKIINSK